MADLRGDPPERPKKPWGWVGLIVRTDFEHADSLFGNHILAGKLWVVSYSRGGLTLVAPHHVARKVSVEAVEPVFAPVYLSPPQYPHALQPQDISEAWTQFRWHLKQIAEAVGE